MYCIIIRFLLLSTLISTTFLNSGVENSEWLTVSFVVSMTSDSRTTKFQYFAVHFSVTYSCLNYSFGMFILIGNIRLEEIKGQVVKLWVTNSGKTLALLITKH